MNENPQGRGIPAGAGSSTVMGFVLGALIGAGIGLLLAPATGKETRQRLANAGRRWGGVARIKLDQARNAANDLQQDAKAALDAGREAFDQSRNSREPRPAPQSELKS